MQAVAKPSLTFLEKSATEVLVRRYIHFGGNCPQVAENGEVRMISVRSSILALGAAAFLSSQAAYAAPVRSTIDPLVSLAVLAGGPSSAAVCAGSAAATAAAVAAVQGAPGCVLPITSPPAPAVAQIAPAPMVQAGAPKTFGTLPLLLGLAAIIAVAALLLSGNGNGHGNPTPISPA